MSYPVKYEDKVQDIGHVQTCPQNSPKSLTLTEKYIFYCTFFFSMRLAPEGLNCLKMH